MRQILLPCFNRDQHFAASKFFNMHVVLYVCIAVSGGIDVIKSAVRQFLSLTTLLVLIGYKVYQPHVGLLLVRS